MFMTMLNTLFKEDVMFKFFGKLEHGFTEKG